MIRISSLDSLDLSGEPFAPDWKGALAHIGPASPSGPLLGLLAGKTTMATVTLMSGVMVWAAKRIGPFYETDFVCEQAEAAFAWQFDWRCFDATAKPSYKPPDQPAAPSAAFVVERFMRKNIKEERDWFSFHPPTRPLFHMVHVTKFILPKEAKPAFQEWLELVSGRLDELAPLPDMTVPDVTDFESKEAYRHHCAPRRGTPLPPEVLDPGIDVAPLELAALAEANLASLDPANNRFLKELPR